MKTAVFFVYVWPEPVSSAAGVRTLDVMRWLQAEGWQIWALSPSKENRFSAELESLGVRVRTCPANDDSADDVLRGLRPDLVVFDRFVMEEQFGWKTRQHWPFAVQLIDTQDMHSLRRAREKLVDASWEDREIPADLSGSEDFLRELAALYRADGALVVSSFEWKLLTERFLFPHERLLCLPLAASASAELPDFSARRGVAFLGNFRHPPNLDGVRWLWRELWPELRRRLPALELHLYGAYPPAEISALDRKQGVRAHGPVTDHRAALRSHRVLLAPLRFGAGIKGKNLEAWACGTVVAGTPIAFEGMADPERDGAGVMFRDAREFVAGVARAHDEQDYWQSTQRAGFARLEADFAPGLLRARLNEFVAVRSKTLRQSGRAGDPIGGMLRLAQHNSTKYFSRWITEKNRGRPGAF